MVSLPAYGVLDHQGRTVAGSILPLYTAQPAPFGIADYGLGASGPYAYNTTNILGQITFNTPPNVTNPGGFDVIDPGANHDGLVNSTHEFTIQLNTVLTNVTQPGSSDGNYWTQNVMDVTDSGIHFVDDVFNQTGSGVDISPNALISGCPGGPSVREILQLYGIYQCVGTTVPIDASNYPLTISLYNNASVNAAHENVLSFGYRFSGANGLLDTGVYDQLVFNSTGQALSPVNPIGFEVSGYYAAPGGSFYDSELILGGAIGGSNAAFSSLSGTASLQYLNQTGAWVNVPSAYNCGTDTGETSTGVATYWTTSHTEVLSAGPSFVYGLWGAVAHVSVPSGDIQFSGSISPTYAFVFVSNVAPTTSEANFSWVPTTAAGTFNTYLPPSIPPYTSYYVQALAAGYTEWNSSGSFSSTTTGYTITMTKLTTVTSFNPVPLYMNGGSQASALANTLTGSSSAPYTFKNMVISPYVTFNHVNDWSYPTFVIFSAENVTAGLTVSNLSEAGSFLYTIDYPLPPFSGLLSPGGATLGPWTNFTDQIQIMDGSNANVTDMTLGGFSLANVYYDTFPVEGGVVFLWDESRVTVKDITAEPSFASPYVGGAGSYGVFVGASVGTVISDVTATGDLCGPLGCYPTDGVTDVGSTGTTVAGVAASDGGWGIAVLSSSDGSYSNISATDYGVGVVAGSIYYASIPNYYLEPGAISATITNVTATSAPSGYPGVGLNLTASTDVTVRDLNGFDGSGGGDLVRSLGTTITNLTGYNGWGIDIWGSNYTNISNYYLTSTPGNYWIGSLWYGSGWTSLTNATFSNYNWGIESYGDVDDSYTDISVLGTFGGLYTQGSSGGSISGLTSDESAYGAWLYDSSGVTVSRVTESNGTAPTYGGGVVIEYGSSDTVSGVVVQDGSVGVWVDDSASDSVSSVTVSGGSIGVIVEYGSTFASVSGVSATATTLVSPWLGTAVFGYPTAAVVTYYAYSTSVSGVNATDYPAALYDGYSNGLTVSTLNATGGMYAVILNGTVNSLFSGINAYKDYQGMLLEEAAVANTITGGSFVDDSSYAIAMVGGAEGNTVYENNFIGNNGATSKYSAAHIQATATGPNSFDLCIEAGVVGCVSGIGNYWADWHTYGPNGYLAPYPISGAVFDFFPIGPQETFTVTFTETGLSSGTNWSVTFNGVTHNSTTSTIAFAATMGTFSYTVNGVSGYQLQSGSTGSVVMTGSPVTVTVVYTSTASLATNGTVDAFFAIALVIALVALILGLIALMMHRRKKAEPTSAAPTAWTPPAGTAGGAGGTGSAPPAGAGGGGSSWSEGSGPSSGGSAGSESPPPPGGN